MKSRLGWKVVFLLAPIALVLVLVVLKRCGDEAEELVERISPSQLRQEVGRQRVAFIEGGGGARHLYILTVDGTEFITLTSHIGVPGVYAAISPDGMQVVYDCESEQLVEFSKDLDACLTQAQGTKEVIACMQRVEEASGITILDLCLMNINGTEQRQLVEASQIPGATSLQAPVFSPDGRDVLFTVGFPNAIELFEVSVDGSDLRRLTRGGYNDQASYSPDGGRIVLECEGGQGLPIQICVMNVDGTERRRLVDNNLEHRWPQFTPDGHHIVFSARKFDSHPISLVLKSMLGRTDYFKLYVMDADGSNVRSLISDERAVALALGSDGKTVVYQAYDERSGENEGIYVINMDGSNKYRIGDNWWDIARQGGGLNK